uniref:Uncharacterized protein n=1 Tax=Anguilla anguilla TaxID=7936 RepID=A0A0E9PUD6_ANGAN
MHTQMLCFIKGGKTSLQHYAKCDNQQYHLANG